jgi:hypothetical protein
VNRLAGFPTLRKYAKQRDWDVGEGFIVGGKDVQRKPASHLTEKRYLPPKALTASGIDESQIQPSLGEEHYCSARTERRFTSPMLLVREQMHLDHAVWDKYYLTYSQRMVGFCAPREDLSKLNSIARWMTEEKRTLQAYIVLTSPGLFAQRATALQADDIYSIPYPVDGSFDLSKNERIVIDDILDYQSEFVRRGEKSSAMRPVEDKDLRAYADILSEQVNALYGSDSFGLRDQFSWSGAVCQAYAFGDVQVDWSGAQELQGRVATLLQAPSHQQLKMTRICRLYDGCFLFILKPDRLRYWLRSIGLRDADDVLADLRAQGY